MTGQIRTVYARLPVQLVAESVAVIVNVNSPSADGVPVIAPSVPSVRPVGRAPAVTAKVFGPAPPAAVTVSE